MEDLHPLRKENSHRVQSLGPSLKVHISVPIRRPSKSRITKQPVKDHQHTTIPVEVNLRQYMTSSAINQPKQVPGKQDQVGIQLKFGDA